MKNTAMDPNPPNNDVVTEILLHLSSKTLLRFRTVCKSWRDLIDSQSFRKSHTHRRTNAASDEEDDDTVLLQFYFCRDRLTELSMLFPVNGKSYNRFPPAFQEFFDERLDHARILNEYGREVTEFGRFVRIVGPVHGLICIHHRRSSGPVAIGNPSLGKINILPPSPICLCNRYHNYTIDRHVGIGFDRVLQDYKVMQLLPSCGGGVSVYSRATNSWRELPGDADGHGGVLGRGMSLRGPIKSTCMSGSFCHWRGFREAGGGSAKEPVLVSFDVENEVFRTLEMPDYVRMQWLFNCKNVKIFAKGDDSFDLFLYNKFDFSNPEGRNNKVMVFRSRIEGSVLHWESLTRVQPFYDVIPKALLEWDCVVLQNCRCNKVELVVYDYCDEECVRCLEVKNGSFKTFEYRGSFVLP